MHKVHLAKDRKLAKLMRHTDIAPVEKEKHIHLALISSIISQQLSTRVARVIYQRFLALFSSKRPKPVDILSIDFDTLRGIGLSMSKTQYVQNVCVFFIENKLTDRKIHSLDNEEVMELFTQIKGIGQWTTEMILMFALGREDVFSMDDYGIQKAMCQLYGIDNTDKRSMKKEMVRISEKWSPYRTYACMYLWKSLQ